MFLSYNTPHSPMQVPDSWWNRVKDRTLSQRATFPEQEDTTFTKAALALAENLDWNIGRVLSLLHSLDLEQETIVIYFSDNGPNSFRWNGGMKGRKGSTDEGGVRSPFCIRWPGHIRKGAVETQWLSYSYHRWLEMIKWIRDMTDTKTFLGIAWNYPPRFKGGGSSQPTEMVANEANIQQSIMTLLSTSPGERVHRYEYGCPIREYAFEMMTASTRTMLRDRIEQSIILFEPRVIVNRIDFEEKQDEGKMNILIDYTIRQTNRRTNMVYPFYFVEGTDLVNL